MMYALYTVNTTDYMENDKGKGDPTETRIRRQNSVIATIAALALGPVFLTIGYFRGLVFAAGPLAYFLVCIVIVPFLTFAAGRLKFLAWQLAIISLTLSVVGDDLRLGIMPSTRILVFGCRFWAVGSLLSSPLPIYFLLRRNHPHEGKGGENRELPPR